MTFETVDMGLGRVVMGEGTGTRCAGAGDTVGQV